MLSALRPPRRTLSLRPFRPFRPFLALYASSAASTEGEQVILEKLSSKFSPSQLKVQDVSGGCGTFYAIIIASEAFKGLSTVKQHRLVTETLKSEIEGIHGLQIKTIPE